MCSTTTTRTTRKITFTVLVVLVVLVAWVLPLLCLLLTVSFITRLKCSHDIPADTCADSKQARDLVSILTEAKQQIDPRLAEMVRYGGGGGGGRGYGGGRGGRGGGRGGNWTGSNNAPLGGSRRW
jgi:hypothetical protein